MTGDFFSTLKMAGHGGCYGLNPAGAESVENKTSCLKYQEGICIKYYRYFLRLLCNTNTHNYTHLRNMQNHNNQCADVLLDYLVL
jgi:hypothetical protein